MSQGAHDLAVEPTAIPDLLLVTMPVHRDSRGWFKENWQREKMVALGLPDFQPVQNNVSFNARAGATRGIHAEPWDKLASVATGRIFGAWVDLREGPSYGRVVTAELGPDKAVFVPAGVGNAFQTLEGGTAYSYLVNDHWSAEARDSYIFVNLADPQLVIPWPIPLEQADLSDADRTHPILSQVEPARRRRTLIVGAQGQLGRELSRLLPSADAVGRSELDLTDEKALDKIPWRNYDVILNAAAFTAVDTAESEEGRRSAWAINVHGSRSLAAHAARHRATLVHISSDYVFDGSRDLHDEEEALSPLGVYGQTKAAADEIVTMTERYYIIRSSWVVGDGANFVRTMATLADRGVQPSVIDDQRGRLTFAQDLARGIIHLLHSRAPYGVYNLTSSGRTMTWADVAEAVFKARGRSGTDVRRVSTNDYGQGRQLAPRPRNSVLDLTKIRSTGFEPVDGDEALALYLEQLPKLRRWNF